MIKFNCSNCSQAYRVSDEYAGKRVRCKSCNHINTIPQPEDDMVGSGDSIAAFNNLLQELSKAEKTAPTVEMESSES